MLDQDIAFFTITDLKQYTYCPRIFYYHACLPDIRPTTYKMHAGIEAHQGEPKRAARRSLVSFGAVGGERIFDVSLISTQLSLTGQIDEVIETESELIPVDYKLARQVGEHFKVQLAAYALLLEENYNRPVRRGFLYLMPLRKAVEVSITASLRRKVHDQLHAMHTVAANEQMPPATAWQQRCADCEFRRFCNDV
ncbi:MAG: CRISPR-associated protein Cas4 [Chloroflexi bacterium]|nr:CRISPR-associated protein Cas4 [Chloroflexota bacterium]